MITIALSLLTAVCYGTADFCGGLATRVSEVTKVLVTSHGVSLAVLLGALVVLPTPTVTMTDWMLSVSAGLFCLLGLVSLYRALGGGEMAVVSAISAVLSALVPVMVGVAAGEVLTARAWSGAALGLVATVMVSVGGGRSRAPHRDRPLTTVLLSVSAGVGIGAMLALTSRCSDNVGLVPVTTMRVMSVVALGGFLMTGLVRSGAHATSRGAGGFLPARPVLASLAGCLDVAGTISFMKASSLGEVAIAAVLAAQYPIVTVGLARGVLGEKVTRMQLVGLAAALLAVALMALG